MPESQTPPEDHEVETPDGPDAPDSPTPPTRGGRRAQPAAIEVTIEIASDQNNSVQFPPTMEILRGRWANSNVLVGQSARNELSRMPDIPGIHIQVSVRQRQARLYDPLAEQPDLVRKINDCYKVIEGKEGGPMKDRTIKDMTPDDIKTWLFWMARTVEAGQARVVKGTLPSLAEIADLPGKTRIEQFNQSARKRKFLEDEPVMH